MSRALDPLSAAAAHRSPARPASTLPVNVGLWLSHTAACDPHGLAVVTPGSRSTSGSREYRKWTFRELDDDSHRLAAGLRGMGIPAGARMVLMVRPGFDFISLVFALFKAGLTTVLVDPGMGTRHLLRCLQESQPEGFIAVPQAHAVRVALRGRFPRARFNVTAGMRWFWGGATLSALRRHSAIGYEPADVAADDPAAIIFTTGSTGPPKGVLYRHGNFAHQVEEIRDRYGIQPGERDVPGFPLFALFNCAMGVATIVPDMDFTRPARVDPRNILSAVRDWQCTQAFGSPALWNAVGRYCEQHKLTGQMPTLKRVLSAGAPVAAHVLRRMRAALADDAEIHTPYGATEALPVASISSREVLGETAALTEQGRGVCVGSRFSGIAWKVIRISDGPLPEIGAVEELPRGEIGELMVRGAVVTREYVTRTDCNALHKVHDGEAVWHRMGDVGYLDDRDRFWFCGRKGHRVNASAGTLFTIPCEAVLNRHPAVFRTALVGVPRAASKTVPSKSDSVLEPVLVVETWPERRPRSRREQALLLQELRDLAAADARTAGIQHVLLHSAFPTDIRHNAKIFREKLAVWAAQQLRRSAGEGAA